MEPNLSECWGYGCYVGLLLKYAHIGSRKILSVSHTLSPEPAPFSVPRACPISRFKLSVIVTRRFSLENKDT